ncbi:hypothetical protein OEA41_008366 [Lepraria neglecta]|uniref:Uncharacterized protein n=1 Tax=Lepraria neglecta TaxID=209136 RepID=A0AAD9ZHA6_9LECA|nr:hypothetical protein OEA41_008366 [Lepraria neglecta]
MIAKDCNSATLHSSAPYSTSRYPLRVTAAQVDRELRIRNALLPPLQKRRLRITGRSTPTRTPSPHIPKIAHYIYSKVQNLICIDHVVVRSTFVYVGVEKVKIWVPEDADLPGEIWGRLQRMENVEVVRIVMPEIVCGTKVQAIQHWSDLARIKILYLLRQRVLALKSSDDIIYSNKTRSTVMPRQHVSANTAANGVIMSKPHSPFLRRWIEKYKDFKPTEWDHTSCTVLVEMWDAGEPDLTLLEEHAWMYPMVRHGGGRESLTDPMLATMWIGKSWWDIERSYGTIRSLFDDLDGDGYYSVPPEQNPNCTATWTKEVRAGEPFSDYQIVRDTTDVRWVDSSGYRLHGYARQGTSILRNSSTAAVTREFTPESHAWLPVPADWDPRVGTARMVFQLDSASWTGKQEIRLFKIRLNYAGELLISLKADNTFFAPSLRFQWLSTYLVEPQYSKVEDAEWTSDVGLPISNSRPNELVLSYDRKISGEACVFVDGQPITNGTLPLVSSAKTGQEIWFNARTWKEKDTGFRGSLNRFSIYPEVVPTHMAQTLSNFTAANRGTLSLTLLPFTSIIILALFVWRARAQRYYKLVRIEGEYKKIGIAVAFGGATLLLLRASLAWET